MAYINLLNICRTGTKALGPGLRYVLWVQGCPFSCPSCLTPEGREIHAKLMTQTEIIAQDIINNPVIDGITISGGEPFLQASSLTDIVNRVRIVRPDFNVIVFTGYKIEQLNWPDAQNFLAVIDTLIDGPYVQNMNNGRGLRGSLNQRIIFLTNRLLKFKEEMENAKRKQDIDIRGEETLFIGIPNKK